MSNDRLVNETNVRSLYTSCLPSTILALFAWPTLYVLLADPLLKYFRVVSDHVIRLASNSLLLGHAHHARQIVYLCSARRPLVLSSTGAPEARQSWINGEQLVVRYTFYLRYVTVH